MLLNANYLGMNHHINLENEKDSTMRTTQHLTSAALLLSSSALITSAFISAPAFAVEPEIKDGIYTIQDSISKKVFDVRNGSTQNDARIDLYSTNSTLAQDFRVVFHEDINAYSIENIKSTKCIEVNGAEPKDNATLSQTSYRNEDQQLWKIMRNGAQYTIQSYKDPTYYLSKKDNDLVLTTSATYWTFTESYKPVENELDNQTFIIRKEGKNRLLEIRNGSTSNQAPLQLCQYNGSKGQQFRFEYNKANKTHSIINNNSGRALDRRNNQQVGEVWQYSKSNSTAQQWRIYKRADSNKYIVLSATSNYGLKADITPDTYRDDHLLYVKCGTPDIFEILPTKNYVLPDGQYTIYAKGGAVSEKKTIKKIQSTTKEITATITAVDANDYIALQKLPATTMSGGVTCRLENTSVTPYSTNPNTGEILTWQATGIYVGKASVTEPMMDIQGPKYLSLDVKNGSKSSGANIQLYTANGTLAQEYIFKRLNNGYYTITNVKSAKVLDVKNGTKKNGGNVWQYKPNGTYAQQWELKFDAQGYATIKNRQSGKVLDIASAKFKNGTNIQQWTSNGTNAQKWLILDSDGYPANKVTVAKPA